jgi:hypothetical protein
MDATTQNPQIPITRPPSGRSARRTRPRIAGIDYARFVAVIGMMATHVWTVNADGTPALIEGIVSGKAAALFALLAGVGVSITTRTDLAAGRAGAARWNIFGRGLALILIGLTLGLSPSGVVVILVYYGVMFWVAIVLLRWSNRVLLIGAVALGLAWPFLSSWLRAGLEEPFELGSASWLSFADPVAFARGLFLTGTYPVPTWIVYVMVGMVAGRLILAAIDNGALRRLGLWFAFVGTVLAGLAWGASALLAGPLGGLAALERQGPGLDPELVRMVFYGTGLGAAPAGDLWWLASPAPHSGTTFDLAITTGVALAALGTCVALGTVLAPAAGRFLEPIRCAGSAPLTIYAAHVIAASVPVVLLQVAGGPAATEGVPWYLSSGQLWALHIAGAITIGAILMLLGRRGPLETFVSWAGRTVSGRLSRQPKRRVGATAR